MIIDAHLAKLFRSNVDCPNCALEYIYLSLDLNNDYQPLESPKISKVAFNNYGIEIVQINGNAVCTAAWQSGEYGTGCVVIPVKDKPAAVHVIFSPGKAKVTLDSEAATGLSLYKVCLRLRT